MKFSDKKKSKTKSRATQLADGVLSEAEKFVRGTEDRFEKTVSPVRNNLIKRFPILFVLAVAFGLTATTTGAEQIILQYDFLRNNPWAIFILGLVILMLTGAAYKIFDKT